MRMESQEEKEMLRKIKPATRLSSPISVYMRGYSFSYPIMHNVRGGSIIRRGPREGESREFA